jgi:hypothetical protein
MSQNKTMSIISAVFTVIKFLSTALPLFFRHSILKTQFIGNHIGTLNITEAVILDLYKKQFCNAVLGVLVNISMYYIDFENKMYFNYWLAVYTIWNLRFCYYNLNNLGSGLMHNLLPVIIQTSWREWFLFRFICLSQASGTYVSRMITGEIKIE